METPFVLAVTVKDEHGNIDLGAIAESQFLINIYQIYICLISICLISIYQYLINICLISIAQLILIR